VVPVEDNENRVVEHNSESRRPRSGVSASMVAKIPSRPGTAGIKRRNSRSYEDINVTPTVSFSITPAPKDSSQSTVPFPYFGVSYNLLQNLHAYVKLKDPNCEWTTLDVSENVIKPWTMSRRCSLAELFQSSYTSTPHPQLALAYSQAVSTTPTVFVSHAWRYNFTELMSALTAFKESHPSTQHYFWIDLCVNNQWEAPSLSYEWWSSTFLSAIGKIGHTCLVLCPWDDPIPLKRAWCLWEIVCTRTTSAKLTIQFSHAERLKFQTILKTNFEYIMKAFSRIDVEDSEAWNPKDKDMIFDVVRKSEGGFQAVNMIVFDAMREWLAESGRVAIDYGDSVYDEDKDVIVNNLHLMTSVGRLMKEIGKYDEAEHLYRLALIGHGHLEECTTIETNIHLDGQLATNNNLAILLNATGRRGEAEELFETILGEYSTLLGPEHRDTLAIKNNLANIYNDRGESGLAASMYNEVLQGYTHTLGENHPETLKCMHNLATVRNDQGRRVEAEELMQKTLKCQREILGVDHPAVLTTMNNLALILYDQMKLDEAEKLYIDAVRGQEKVMGARHPKVFQTQGNLANLYRDKGRMGDAKEMYIKVVNGQSEVLGDDHPDTLLSMNNLANLLCDMEKYNEAEVFYKRSYAGQLQSLGDCHEETLGTVYNLAIFYKQVENYDLADQYGRMAYDGYMKLLGPSHYNTLSACHNVAVILKSSGKHSEAEFFFRQALTGQQAFLGSDHEDTLRTMYNLAYLLSETKKITEAEELFRSALEGRRKVFGRNDEISTTTAVSLAELLIEKDDIDGAEAIYNEIKAVLDLKEEKSEEEVSILEDVNDKLATIAEFKAEDVGDEDGDDDA